MKENSNAHIALSWAFMIVMIVAVLLIGQYMM